MMALCYRNELGIDGTLELARYISSGNCAIRHLNLSSNIIRDQGCIELSRAIRVNKTIERYGTNQYCLPYCTISFVTR